MSDYKKCPYCCEEIRFEAIKCKHCLSYLETKGVPEMKKQKSSPDEHFFSQEKFELKLCPECSKEIPIQAILCWYCNAMVKNHNSNSDGSSSSTYVFDNQVNAKDASSFRKANELNTPPIINTMAAVFLILVFASAKTLINNFQTGYYNLYHLDYLIDFFLLIIVLMSAIGLILKMRLAYISSIVVLSIFCLTGIISIVVGLISGAPLFSFAFPTIMLIVSSVLLFAMLKKKTRSFFAKNKQNL